MKKILMAHLCALLTAHLFSTPVEFNSSVGFTVPVDDDNRMVRDISEIKWNCGLRLNLGSTMLAGNARLGSTPLIELRGNTPKDYLLIQEYSYGIWHSENLGKVKVDVLAGNLKFSGGISRLKTPSFTCPSPQRESSFQITGFTSSLPSSSSSKSIFSWTAALIPKSPEIPLPAMQIAILESGERYGSLYRKFTCHFIPEISFSFTAGTFFHEYSKESGWFQNERYYNESDFLSSEFSALLAWRNFKTLTSIGIYENPFGGTRQWLRNKSSLTAGFFSLGLLFFNADEDIITASGNTPRIGQQIFLSPRFNFKTGKGIFSLGSSFGETSRKTKKRMASPYSQYDLKLGGSYTTMKYQLKGNYDYTYSTETGKDKASFGIDGGIIFMKVKSNTSFTTSISEDKSRKYKLSEKINFKKSFFESLTAAWTWTEGKEKEKWNLDASANFSRKTKYFLMKGKISFSFRKAS